MASGAPLVPLVDSLVPKPPAISIPEPEPVRAMPDPGDILKKKRKQQEAAQRFQTTTLLSDAEDRQTLG